jgi:hypothetical protein
MGAVCSLRKTLTDYDLRNMTDDDGHITRESVERWVMLNSGDFSEIIDWSGSLEVGDQTIEFPWEHEESEEQYADTLASVDD